MNWKSKTMLYYALGGLLIGVIAGLVSINNAVEENKEVKLSFENGAKIGLAALKALPKIISK